MHRAHLNVAHSRAAEDPKLELEMAMDVFRQATTGEKAAANQSSDVRLALRILRLAVEKTHSRDA